MAQRIDDRRRQVVPRWWPYRVAASLGELDAVSPIREAGSPRLDPSEIEQLLQDWHHNQNPFHAATLIDAALMSGQLSIAADAADWVLQNGGVSDVSLELAREVLTPSQPQFEAISAPAPQKRWKRIAAYRHNLRSSPRDSLLWVDLAREYSALGQIEPARRALRIAMGLSPDNRFVLRSASRFHLHAHDPEQAHALLLSSPATPRDPWLLSAEIVAAQAHGKKSRLIKRSQRLLAADKFHPRHTSELASALGTLELKTGRRKTARNLIEQALVDPTENAVAQAAWVARHVPSFEVPDSSLATPRAYEAVAWEAMAEENFDLAVRSSHEWFGDEPFATRPALFGSWVAAIAQGDFTTALEFAEAALVANPGDPRLIVQQLYCLASDGRTEEAERLIPVLEDAAKRGDGDRSPEEWDVLLHADKGLIAFRKGFTEQGRTHYEQALAIANNKGLSESAGMVYINYMREELLACSSSRLDFNELPRVIEMLPRVSRGAAVRFIERLGVPAS